MSEWWSYGLSDFLMFSPATYWRLVERYNRDVWPLQPPMLLLGGALLWWVGTGRPAAARAVPAALAAVWLWVGWAFHWQRYAPINWAAEYFAAAFGLQAVLLLAAALGRGRDPARPVGSQGGLGLALAGIAVVAYPLLAPLAGRPWSRAEAFGVMPEPTALATLGLLLAMRQPHGAWLMLIPCLSLLVGTATWVQMRG